jgi:hypothetical protein
MRFQERAWLIKRAGCVLLAILILLALAGVFSNGLLSAATAERDGVPLSVGYERFQRRNAPTHFTIKVPRQTEDEVWLRFGPAFQHAYDIEAVQPPPVRSNFGNAGLSLFFDAYDQSDLNVVIRARPKRVGAINVEIARLPGSLQMPVLIYP